MKISAVIISFNEEKNIAKALSSVSWADELLVIDSESTDNTRAIAESLGARVIIKKWPGFAEQKQFATDSAAHDLILSLDADERVTAGLRDEIEALLRSEVLADGYRISRQSYYMGKAIKHGGWYPDRQLRLFDRRKARWKQVHVHESVEMGNGTSADNLEGDIVHYTVESPLHHHRMIGERYAPLAAQKMFDEGRRTSAVRTSFAVPIKFIQCYFLKAGFLDGFPGFCIACFAAHHTFLKHLILWELQHREGPR
ncbi:MAG: glycosyltransferase family 2 protein [Pyrinomonadaceae bacterium]